MIRELDVGIIYGFVCGIILTLGMIYYVAPTFGQLQGLGDSCYDNYIGEKYQYKCIRDIISDNPAQSFQMGNNTIANVTAPIVDLNDNKRNASDMRFNIQLYPEFNPDQSDWDRIFERPPDPAKNNDTIIIREVNVPLCPTELNTSNFTERIWNKYCVDPQTDADYEGILK